MQKWHRSYLRNSAANKYYSPVGHHEQKKQKTTGQIDFSEFSRSPSGVTSIIVGREVSLLHLLTTPTPLLLVTHPSPTLSLPPHLSHGRVLVLSIRRDSIKQFPMKYPLEKIKLFNAK